ncbi:hypothetical protein [Actinospica robiniae]|uniref:hypothetical protein n=1 Tax=Actinospica robiniae TaxID=304901 RepID=UPI000406D22D|nr:hypothetical protein [Actinospica robiniae]
MSGEEPADTPEREPAVADVATNTAMDAAAAPADGWTSPDGAAPTAATAPTMAVPAPTMAVPVAQPQAPAAGQPGYGYGIPQPYQHMPSPEEIQAAVVATRKRKRRLWTLAAVVAVVAVVGAGVTVYENERHGDSVVSAVTCTPSKLVSCLIKQPAGALTLSDTPTWDQAAVPTADTFGTHMTADAKGMTDQSSILVSGDGANSFAHTDWNAVDGNDVDMVLIKFDTIKGAQSWNATRNGEILAAYPGQAAAVPGDSAEKAHAAAKADATGTFHAAYSAVVGNMVLNLSYSSPNTFDPADLQNWAGTELTSLWSAPAPAKDPADSTGNGTEDVACPDLRACLPSMPSGYVPWGASANSDWIGATSLTVKQFVDGRWDKKSRSEVISDLEADDVTGIVQIDWVDASSRQADIYLLKTLTQSAATALFNEFDEPSDFEGYIKSNAYSTGATGVDAWYGSRADPDGLVQSTFTGQVGNIVLAGSVNFEGHFDKSLAGKWIADAVKRVQGTKSTQPIGLPSLATPTIQIPAQGSCAASGDCLMAQPSDSKDTTTTSKVARTKSVSAMQYSSGYESDETMQYDTWLSSDGFQSAEHRSWTSSSSGANAEGALVKFGSPAEAQAAALLEYGLGTENDRDCTISSISNALCMATPVGVNDYFQMETVTVLAWKGDYEVRVNVTISNEAQVAQAYAWAEQQLATLPAS